MNESTNSLEPVDRVIVTIHGIRTFGQWQERLSLMLALVNPKLVVENFHYGYFSVVAFLIPPLRWFATIRFRRHISEIASRYPYAKLSFVAHSFGTHLLAYGIYGMKPAHRPQIDTVILAGSVLRSTFPWGELFNARALRQLINDCGTRDNVLLLSQFCVLFTGMAGRLGFYGMTSKRLLNRFFHGGHSHYFEDKSGAQDSYMRRYWVPVLAEGVDPLLYDDRKTHGPLQGIVLTLLQVADPIKILVYLTIAGVVSFYIYFRPAMELRASVTREAVTELNRVTTLSRTYFENRGDVARAVATLSPSISVAAHANIESRIQRRLLSFWLQRLTRLDAVLKEGGVPQVARWSMETYLISNGIATALPSSIAAGVMLESSDRALLIGIDDVARVVRLSDMVIEREIRIPRPKESMDGQAESGKYSVELFNRYKNGIENGEIKLIDDLAQMDDSQQATELASERASTISFNDVEWQATLAEALYWDAIRFDKESGLVVVAGTARTHSAGSPLGLLVIDPEQGQIAGMTYQAKNDVTTLCEPATVRSMELDGVFTIRLRQGDEKSLLHIELPDDGAIKSQEKRLPENGCDEILIASELESNLIFPKLIQERELWSHSAPEGKELEVVETIMEEQEELLRGPASKLTEEWRFAGLRNQDGPNGWLFQIRFELGKAYQLSWNPKVSWVMGADGMKYGFFTFCRFENDIARACFYARCRGNFCHAAGAPDHRLIALSSYKEFGNDSLYVVNADTMDAIKLPNTPRGGVSSLRFDKRGRLSVFTTFSELWLYSDLNTVPKVQSLRLNPTHVTDDDDVPDPQFVNGDPLAIFEDGSIARIDPFTLAAKWVSSKVSLPGPGSVSFRTSPNGLILAHNDTSVRLLDGETGAFVTDVMDFREMLATGQENTAGESADPYVHSVTWYDDGSVGIAFGDTKFTRAAPISDMDVDRILSRVEQFTGMESSGAILPRLPDAR